MEIQMIPGILEHTPSWVWMVFLALTFLGLSQTRTRDVSRARVTLLPAAMVLLSLSGVLNAFSQVPLALAAWIAGFVLSLTLAGRTLAVRDASWSSRTRRIRIPGSWLPVTLILGLFVTKYVAGVCLAINPSLATNTALASLLSLVYGSFSGLFWGRGERCWP